MHLVKLPRIFQPFQCKDLVRLGAANDSGYLVNQQDVLRSQRLVSLGIGENWSFEKDFVRANDCELWAYDVCADVEKEDFKAFFQGRHRYLAQNIGKKTGEVPLESIIVGDDNFLKCDIEGGEYFILRDIINHSRNFTGLVIEFHDVNKPENFNALTDFISKIDQKLVHIHINNYFYYKTDQGNIPDILELTFSSAKNILLADKVTLPHPFDRPNNPADEQFEITF